MSQFTFKKPKRPKKLRKAAPEETLDEPEECEEEITGEVLQDIREIQKLRKRPIGFSATDFAASSDEGLGLKALGSNDPLKIRTGGLVDLKRLKRSDWAHVNVEDNIKQNFSKESHMRDEDEEMRRYVEQRLQDMREGDPCGTTSAMETVPGSQNPEDTLYALPERLKEYQSKRTEEMLSNQMLSGIPEVDLGVEAKIRNIEETEAAKLRLLKEAIRKKMDLEKQTTARQDLEKDLAQSYVQHSRYKIDNTTHTGTEIKLVRPPTEVLPVVDEDTPKWVLFQKTPGGKNIGHALKIYKEKPTDLKNPP